MRLWHHVTQAILAQDPLTTSLSATPSTPSTSSMTPVTTSPSDPTNSITATSGSNNTANTTLYFGYGSNLWLKQMHQRCPNSTYLGIARLNGFKWIINERGYANVVEIERQRFTSDASSFGHSSAATPIPRTSENEQKRKEDYETQVWGMVYSLQPSDEARLDRNEGVPVAYDKESLECDFWAAVNGSQPANVTGEEPEKVDMLVYINRDAVTPSQPKREYVYRMNMGIRDAVKEGVPEGYVERVMRRFIPEMEDEGEVVEVAKKQALEFEDER